MLRDYQQSGIDQLRQSIASGFKRIMYYSPTGSGKSVVAQSIIESALSKGKKVAFLVNRKGLVNQFSARLQGCGILHGILQGQNTFGLSMNVIVGTVQTASRRGLPNVDMVLIDEAHGATSNEYRKLICSRSDVIWIGLSATPFTKGLGKHEEALGGPLFQDMIVATTIRKLIVEGNLVDCEIYAPSEPDLKGVKLQRNQFGEMDYNEKQLSKAVDKPDLIGDIVENWCQLAYGEQTVVFATNIEHSKHIVDKFAALGVKVEHIDGYMTDEERDPILKRFESGETNVLSNVAVLREGWDCPSCSVMILARPTKSMTTWIQMCGRALRPYKGKPYAMIIDHSGSVYELGSPTDDLTLELDDGTPKKVEKKAKTKEKSKEKKCPKCSFIKSTLICPKCGFKLEKQIIEHADGELKKVAKKEDKQAFYSEMIYYAASKGYKPGYAANKYREKFGVWPRGLQEYAKEPSESTLNWLKHTQIKYAHRRVA